MPCALASVALVGAVRLIAKVSSASGVVSPLTVTAMVWVVAPGAKVSVPLAPM